MCVPERVADGPDDIVPGSVLRSGSVVAYGRIAEVGRSVAGLHKRLPLGRGLSLQDVAGQIAV